ncbi:MAG: class I SAM-dependent RNA methyltransferase [Candidatus Omnitrophica bacterium]|nr:class I SAM-dependent RNA methyltransferase [Candidatus Omnitrophota bacterium]
MSETTHTEKPLCTFFGQCGGCQYQDIPYDEELKLKGAAFKEALSAKVDASLWEIKPVVASPKVYNYRNRLDLKLVRTRKATIHIGYSPAQRGQVLEIDRCPIGIEKIGDYIATLRADASANLPEKYRMANLTLRCGDGDKVFWGGIGRKSNHLSPENYFYFLFNGKKIHYSLDTFFQANLSILPLLAEQMRALPIWSPEVVVFDLYGGVGLLGLMVHDLVKGVINIEENTHSVTVAEYNVKANGIGNVATLEGRVENVLPGLLDQMDCADNVIIVDPPRAGLTDKAIENINGLTKVRHMLYLSCNPETLAANLSGLMAGGWKVSFIQPFDFFPRTRHLEALVLLSR